jgi:iron complex outermembrane receptor protein
MLAVAGAGLVVISPPAAYAAAVPAAQPESGEVLVTARERQEALHSVPSQVTAFTSQEIRNKGIVMPRDFIQAVPNVTLVETQNAGTSFVVIRGISQARNSEPSVAVVVDGVPQTQPAQFNQSLVDIQQIEVLKGPQGALYGRNAIGGAILITTQGPTDHWTGSATAGYESGPGGKGQAVISGPLSDTLGMRAAVSYINSSGHIENTYLHSKADPVSDLSGRLRFVWRPTDKLSVDLRLSADRLWTQAFYYNITYYPPYFQPPGNTLTVPDVNNVSLPVRVNNPGKNNRAIYDASIKMDYDAEAGTFTSISGVNLTKEILTGDSFDFLPIDQSILHTFAGFDQNQSQYLRVRTLTQELRFTSPADRRVRWIVGGQMFLTSRFISTGNEWDTGNGVVPTFYTPTTPGPEYPLFSNSQHPQATFLSDSQDNTAFGIYLATSTDLTKDLELSLNMRYDIDRRHNTTQTPQTFLDAAGIPAKTGDLREASFHAWQPQAILKYHPTDELMLYVSYSRGFRSGGFNQTGVATAAAAAGFAGVGDLFNAETADTIEGGIKQRLFNRRVSFNVSGYTTVSKNGYFFVYLASNSTQNLGNIPQVRYTGFDADLTAHVTDDVDVSAGFGYTDSNVEKYYHSTFPQYDFRLGEQAPLVSRYTFNASGQWRPRLNERLNALLRLDYTLIGPTYFWESDPNVLFVGAPPVISRRVVGLLDARAGVEGRDWSLVFWARNLNNHIYNAEYSPGGFVFKAQPRRWGVDLTKRF